jgi:hypothetical protein
MSKQHFNSSNQVLVDCPCAARGGGAFIGAVPVPKRYLELGFHGVPDCLSFIQDSHPTCLWVCLWAPKTLLPASIVAPCLTLFVIFY